MNFIKLNRIWTRKFVVRNATYVYELHCCILFYSFFVLFYLPNNKIISSYKHIIASNSNSISSHCILHRICCAIDSNLKLYIFSETDFNLLRKQNMYKELVIMLLPISLLKINYFFHLEIWFLNLKHFKKITKVNIFNKLSAKKLNDWKKIQCIKNKSIL